MMKCFRAIAFLFSPFAKNKEGDFKRHDNEIDFIYYNNVLKCRVSISEKTKIKHIVDMFGIGGKEHSFLIINGMPVTGKDLDKTIGFYKSTHGIKSLRLAKMWICENV